MRNGEGERDTRRKRASTSTSAKPKNKDLVLYLEKLFLILQSKDAYELFHKPVDVTVAPDYSKMVSKPMDFSTMKRKIEKDEYEGVQDFQTDFELMCENALSYYPSHSISYKEASKLLSFGKKLFAQEVNKKQEEEKENGEENQEVKRKKVLYRRGADGSFLFSSLPKGTLPEGSLDAEMVNIREVEVEEVKSELWEPMTIGRILPVTVQEEEEKIPLNGVKYFQGDDSASFFPRYDSWNSDLTAEETMEIQLAYSESECKTLSSFVDEMEDFMKGHIDRILVCMSTKGSNGGVEDVYKAIEASKEGENELTEGSGMTVDSANISVSSLNAPIEEACNEISSMIKELLRLQNERLASKEVEITSLEYTLAKQTQLALANLAASRKPKELMDTRRAMKNLVRVLPPKEPLFKGTLPPAKPFAFASNSTAPSTVPITANMVPVHFNKPPPHAPKTSSFKPKYPTL